jgi:hypothetical protein
LDFTRTALNQPVQHDLRQSPGVVATGLAHLQRQAGLGVAGIDHLHRQATLLELVPEPDRERAGLEADPAGLGSLRAQPIGQRLGLARDLALGEHLAVVVDHAQGRHLERDI